MFKLSGVCISGEHGEALGTIPNASILPSLPLFLSPSPPPCSPLRRAAVATQWPPLAPGSGLGRGSRDPPAVPAGARSSNPPGKRRESGGALSCGSCALPPADV